MILVLDNYDSFTFNLVQAFGTMGHAVEVHRNDTLSVEQVQARNPTHLVISPGPGHPRDAGISVELVRRLHGRLPILGVCLGHQAIAVAAGGRIESASDLMHGKASDVHHSAEGLFRGLPNPLPAGRYHSLIVPEESLPAPLEVTARTADGAVMALRWRDTCTVGVQFHPESILTPAGERLLANFLEAPQRPC